MRASIAAQLAAIALTASSARASSLPYHRRSSSGQCRETEVLILGAGTAGITAAQALSNASVTDFLIVEYNGDIGGRVAHTTMGSTNGTGVVVELGANWVQGLVSPGGPENPIWTLAQKYNVENTYSDYSNISTYTQNGAVDYTDLLDTFEDAYSELEEDAGYILSENLQDRTVRAGLSISGWMPGENMEAQAAEWWEWDWEYAYSPDESSQVFGIVNYNTTFYQFSEENNYVFDQRGFNAFIKGEASTFLGPNYKSDPRLLLNTVVSNISHNSDGVTVTTSNGTCFHASYAICTFSLGVLQHDVISFSPALPKWKRTALAQFQMGTYTKIFLQFPTTFWPAYTQFFLYADPYTRGYYPVFQSLSTPGFLPGSNIIFVTVVHQQAYRAERLSDAAVQAEVMEVLYSMFGRANVPDPTAFLMPRWSTVPWAYGSYSNWPPATTLEMHQNLRANLGRLWFAGEATSAEYFGFLQGAYFEGQSVGEAIAGCVKNGTGCGSEKRYEVLHGTTPEAQYDLANGWEVTSFQTIGDV